MLVLAPVLQPWWQCPQLMQPGRSGAPACDHAAETTAAGAAAVRMPNAAHPARIASAGAFSATGGNG